MPADSLPIAAIATAPGRGAIGVVRISGKQIQAVIDAVCNLKNAAQLVPRHATYLEFLNTDGSVIDRGLALFFPAPHSYTGENLLELHGHGGPVVMQMLLARCLQAGAEIGLRLALPGEFTQRAFLNNKLDLAQAEAVADLIDASTEAAVKSAARSLTGAFSDTIRALVAQLITLRMLVEATLDFPEEEIDFLKKSQARTQLTNISAALEQVFRQAAQGAIMRDGLNIVLAGQPNVGKSSLLNALAGSEVAIVTAIAGTTRDRVIETIQIDSVPINIIDTAGIRELNPLGDEVERLGIERTWGAVGSADVIVHMLDATRGPTKADEQIDARFPEHVPVIRAWNKIDLSGHKPALTAAGAITDVYLSVVERLGIDLLRSELLRLAGWQTTGESLFLARERHLLALQAAQQHLQLASSYADQGDAALDLFAEELRLAQQCLNSITGEFGSDDLLGVIFSRFCIGK